MRKAGRCRRRWQRIIQEAAEQSGRAIVPTLHEALTFQAALKSLASALSIIPALEAQTTLRQAISTVNLDNLNINIFIGPEGGFTPEEVQEADSAGVHPITLGPRILRAETAAVASLTMTLYELGEMGNNR